MANDSTVAGFLTPVTPPVVLEDDALADFFQPIFVGLTGLAGEFVRPRWQPEPPDQPDRDQNWIAFGIVDEAPDTYAAVVHDPDGSGDDELQQHEDVDILVSAYGPNARGMLKLIAGGLQISQNRAPLIAAGMNLKETGRIVSAPTLAKDVWLNRCDMHVIIRRGVFRRYQVRNIESAEAALTDGPNDTVINVNPPPVP